MFLKVLITLLAFLPTFSSAQTFQDVFFSQSKLTALGYDVGESDGRMGPSTQRGLDAASVEYGFEPNTRGLIRYFSVDTISRRFQLDDGSLKTAIIDDVNNKLLDPFSSQFRYFYQLPSGSVCGEVNAKNTYGAYTGWTPFFVTATTPIGDKFYVMSVLNNPAVNFARYYCMLDIAN